MKFSKEPNLKREPKLSEQVTAFLLKELNSGALKPGESLPSEAELSYRFNVSRTVIREALAQLKSEGVVESRRGSRSKISTGFNRFFRINQSVHLNLSKLYEFKTILESDVAMLAAIYRTKDDMVVLKACLEALKKALEKGVDGTSANLDFHRAISKACHNRYLVDFSMFVDETLWDLIQAEENQSSNLPLTSRSMEEHTKIYEAIHKKEASFAREAMLTHLKNSAERRGIHLNL